MYKNRIDLNRRLCVLLREFLLCTSNGYWLHTDELPGPSFALTTILCFSHSTPKAICYTLDVFILPFPSFEDISCLSQSLSINELSLDGNPFAAEVVYKQTVLKNIATIRQLDMKRISVRFCSVYACIYSMYVCI